MMDVNNVERYYSGLELEAGGMMVGWRVLCCGYCTKNLTIRVNETKSRQL